MIVLLPSIVVRIPIAIPIALVATILRMVNPYIPIQ